MRRSQSIFIVLVCVMLMAACAPAAPAPTAVPPTITAAPTLTLTTAPTATPTLTPAPTEIPIPEGAVQAADGSSLFVEDGKLFAIKDGNKIEADLDNYAFNNIDAPQELLVQLNPELFQGDQAALVEFLMPGGFVAEGEYYYAINNVRWGGDLQGGIATPEVVGKHLSIIEVKAPADYPADSVYVSMIAINGLAEPLPMIVGLKKDGKTTLIIDGAAEFNLLQYSVMSKPMSVNKYNNIQELGIALRNERIAIFIPIGVLKNTDQFIDNTYRHQDESIRVAENYFIDKYGIKIYQFIYDKGFNGVERGTTGNFLESILAVIKTDSDNEAFLGFIPQNHQVRKFLPK